MSAIGFAGGVIVVGSVPLLQVAEKVGPPIGTSVAARREKPAVVPALMPSQYSPGESVASAAVVWPYFGPVPDPTASAVRKRRAEPSAA